MKAKNTGLEGNGNVENLPGTGASPKAAEENPGVTYGIGIPNVASNKNSKKKDAQGNNNVQRRFSNERPIF